MIQLGKHYWQWGSLLTLLLTTGQWASAQTSYNYTDIPGSPIAIDGTTTCTAPITRTIAVTDNFIIGDLDVGFIASHAWRGDIEATLTAPDTTSVQIIAGVGGGVDNINALLDSASSNALADGINHSTTATPYQYTRAPSSSLDAFNGKQANGNWTLEICDNYPSLDDGTYIRGELAFVDDSTGGGGGFTGTSTIPATGTVINSYHKVTALSGTSVSVDTSAGISAGDRGVLIQMKGATIDTSDTATHGDISSYASAGRFEYVDVASVSGSTLILETAPTVSFQASGYVQFVRVPIYENTTISGTISATPWNGDKGGVVAIDDIGTLTLSGDINVTGLGFAGGALTPEVPYDSCASDQSNYTGPLQNGTGNKGEGITAPNASHVSRRGHKANGGGGGNITDAGGGGGANYGFGGLGGRELDLCDGSSPTHNTGGLGGQPLDYSPANRIFFGGGGGSGSEVSQTAAGGDRSGGGIILIRAKAVNSTGGRLIANGLSALQDNNNGADGGAAAGTIAVSVHDSVTGLPVAQGDGGDGGDEANGSYAHGTGGGGGGGSLWLNGAVCADFSFQFDGGEAGMSQLGNAAGDPTWGATDGGPGTCTGNFTALPLIPIPGATLTGSKDVTIWDPLGEGLYAVPGNDVIYTITASNAGDGPADTDSIVLIDIMPNDVEFYNGDIDDGGPETDAVSFTQSTGAGLTFSYATDVGYSDSTTRPTDFSQCSYTPTAGYDPNVTYICFNPKGAMTDGDPDPEFSVSFRARIK